MDGAARVVWIRTRSKDAQDAFFELIEAAGDSAHPKAAFAISEDGCDRIAGQAIVRGVTFKAAFGSLPKKATQPTSISPSPNDVVFRQNGADACLRQTILETIVENSRLV